MQKCIGKSGCLKNSKNKPNQGFVQYLGNFSVNDAKLHFST